MANLIPFQAKQNIKTEYWIRVGTLWLFLLSVAALTLAVLNTPVYLLIQNQLQSNDALFNDASAQNDSFEKIESEIILANETAILLAGMKNVPPLVPYIEQIEALTPSGVQVDTFSIERDDKKVNVVQVSGKSADRASLVEFSDRIEATETFETAEIPLSNLAKDRDIPFTISVELSDS